MSKVYFITAEVDGKIQYVERTRGNTYSVVDKVDASNLNTIASKNRRSIQGQFNRMMQSCAFNDITLRETE